MPTSALFSKQPLTERNLRLNSAVHLKTGRDFKTQVMEEQTQTGASDFFHLYNIEDCDESDDDVMRDIALRRAASLEALQAYGGCFVSGFLAMQDPLPWLSPTITRTASSSSAMTTTTTGTGNPRPDSDTLSSVDAKEVGHGRKQKWRSMRRLRSGRSKVKK